MNEERDDTVEFLLEEYALNRLHGEGLARAEEMLKQQPNLRARVAELRSEAEAVTGAIAHASTPGAGPIPDTTLALLLDGALDELEHAALEASLGGDRASQARLAELYRETNAIRNNEPLPEPLATQEPVTLAYPAPAGEKTRSVPIKVNALLVCGVCAVVSVLAPAPVAVPALFLSLGAFAWWTVERAATGALKPTPRMRSCWGLGPALIVFVAGLFAGPYGLWCYVCGAGWYWYWLLQRRGLVQAVAVSEPAEADREEARVRRKRG